MKGCFNNSLALYLSPGDFLRQRVTNPVKSLLHLSLFFSLGSGPFNIFSITAIKLLSTKGGSPSAISNNKIPKLQISTALVYSFSIISSGAIQLGLMFKACAALVNCAAYPKSPSFISPNSEIITFLLFTSL